MIAAPAPLAILHRDERIVVVHKPAGLLVHRTRAGSGEDALLQRLRDQLGRRVYPVQRLDRATSGLLAYALDPDSARLLQAALAAPSAVKEYLVLARGLTERAFESRAPLVDERGTLRAARSAFERVTAFPAARVSLLRARLATGRTHQIRRHLALAGHHVLGDPRYGNARANRLARARLGLVRMFLHAARLELEHPAGGRLALHDPLPAELAAVLRRLGDDGQAGVISMDAPARSQAQGRLA